MLNKPLFARPGAVTAEIAELTEETIAISVLILRVLCELCGKMLGTSI
jgi:hypothetical protein